MRKIIIIAAMMFSGIAMAEWDPFKSMTGGGKSAYKGIHPCDKLSEMKTENDIRISEYIENLEYYHGRKLSEEMKEYIETVSISHALIQQKRNCEKTK